MAPKICPHLQQTHDMTPKNFKPALPGKIRSLPFLMMMTLMTVADL